MRRGGAQPRRLPGVAANFERAANLVEAPPGEGEQRHGLLTPMERVRVADLPQPLLELDPVEQIDDLGQGALRLGFPLHAASFGSAPRGHLARTDVSGLPRVQTIGFQTHWLFPPQVTTAN